MRELGQALWAHSARRPPHAAQLRLNTRHQDLFNIRGSGHQPPPGFQPAHPYTKTFLGFLQKGLNVVVYSFSL